MTTAGEADWRLQGQERYLRGVTLVHRRYRRNPKKAAWDHDHCEFCGAKFMVEDFPEVLHHGYATEDDYRWICEPCFTDFRETFKWQVVEEERSDQPMNAAVELHDSTVAGIVQRDGTVIVHFQPAYLHKSQGRPGYDAGTGWVQDARLLFDDASVSGGIPDLPCAIMDGEFVVGSEKHANSIPMPLAFTEPAELRLVFDTVHTMTVKGRSVRLEMLERTGFVGGCV